MNERYSPGDRVTFSWRGARGWRHDVPAVIASWLQTAHVELLWCGTITTRLVPTASLSTRLRHCAELDSNHHQKEYAS